MKFFDQKVKVPRVKKSKFDLSHERKFSFNMGEIVPILVQDVMPGDSFRVSTEQMLRVAPMIAPMMHRVNTYMHYFFVPNRLVWDEWEQFITGGQQGSTPPLMPTMLAGKVSGVTGGNLWGPGSLADYMGIPTYGDGSEIVDATSMTEISALPFRAMQLIYMEYFRDQDLQDMGPNIDRSSGPISPSLYAQILRMWQRCWEKDYYTSARPWANKGGNVGIPFTYSDISALKDVNGNNINVDSMVGMNTGGAGGLVVGKTNIVGTGTPGRIENLESIATINEFREANALQIFLEKITRAGSRYIEYIKMIFDETSSDSRLQRPEYLGGGRSPLVISEVLSTFDNTTNGLPQGTMSGHGIGVGNTQGFTQQFNEHGYIIGVMSVLPRTGYQQGIDKHFTRMDQFDFPIPDFAHLGEQAVKNQEVFMSYAEPDNTLNEATFGYQSRYSECKFKNSTSHGDFRTSLAFYHMDRIFPTRPALNDTFVKADPTTRVFAITDPDQDHLWCQVHNDVSAVRPLPYHGVPSI